LVLPSGFSRALTDFGQTMVDAFKDEGGKGDEALDYPQSVDKSAAVATRLLQKSQVEEKPGLRATMLEFAFLPSAEEEDREQAVRDAVKHVGPIDSALFVLSEPLVATFRGEPGVEPPILTETLDVDEYWRGEAKRALQLYKASKEAAGGYKGAPLAEPNANFSIALLYGVSLPGFYGIQAYADLGDASKIGEVLEQLDVKGRVEQKFESALHEVALDEGLELPRGVCVRAFCGAVTRKKDRMAYLPCKSLLTAAASWGMGEGAGPVQTPPIENLRLKERILGYMSRFVVGMYQSTPMPFRSKWSTPTFQYAIDSVLADLIEVEEEWPQVLLSEWPDSADLGLGEVRDLKQFLMSLEPPEGLEGISTADGWWKGMERKLGEMLSEHAEDGPCASWWHARCPAFNQSLRKTSLPVPVPRPRLMEMPPFLDKSRGEHISRVEKRDDVLQATHSKLSRTRLSSPAARKATSKSPTRKKARYGPQAIDQLARKLHPERYEEEPAATGAADLQDFIRRRNEWAENLLATCVARAMGTKE